jgi:hypothetical protein
MQKTLLLASAALFVTLPSLAFAQSTGAGMQPNAPASSMPSSTEDKTPAVGTPTSEGRSSSTVPQSNPAKPDVDGVHPSGQKLDSMKK